MCNWCILYLIFLLIYYLINYYLGKKFNFLTICSFCSSNKPGEEEKEFHLRLLRFLSPSLFSLAFSSFLLSILHCFGSIIQNFFNFVIIYIPPLQTCTTKQLLLLLKIAMFGSFFLFFLFFLFCPKRCMTLIYNSWVSKITKILCIHKLQKYPKVNSELPSKL